VKPETKLQRAIDYHASSVRDRDTVREALRRVQGEVETLATEEARLLALQAELRVAAECGDTEAGTRLPVVRASVADATAKRREAESALPGLIRAEVAKSLAVQPALNAVKAALPLVAGPREAHLRSAALHAFEAFCRAQREWLDFAFASELPCDGAHCLHDPERTGVIGLRAIARDHGLDPTSFSSRYDMQDSTHPIGPAEVLRLATETSD